jgi:hypothetical protein
MIILVILLGNMTVKWINNLILWMEGEVCLYRRAKEGMSMSLDRPLTTFLVAKEQKKKVEILP